MVVKAAVSCLSPTFPSFQGLRYANSAISTSSFFSGNKNYQRRHELSSMSKTEEKKIELRAFLNSSKHLLYQKFLNRLYDPLVFYSESMNDLRLLVKEEKSNTIRNTFKCKK